jgi:putative flippase GtrA
MITAAKTLMTEGLSRERALFLVRYVIVGGSVAVLYALVYWLAEPQLSAYGAATIAFASAIVAQYIGHAKFTFGVPAKNRGQLFRFIVTTCFGYMTAMSVAWASETYGLGRGPSVVAMLVLIPIVNFLVFVFWVFVKKDPETAEKPDQSPEF